MGRRSDKLEPYALHLLQPGESKLVMAWHGASISRLHTWLARRMGASGLFTIATQWNGFVVTRKPTPNYEQP